MEKALRTLHRPYRAGWLGTRAFSNTPCRHLAPRVATRRTQSELCKARAYGKGAPEVPLQSKYLDLQQGEAFTTVTDALKALSQIRKSIVEPRQQLSDSEIEAEQRAASAALQQWVQAAENVIPQTSPRQAAGVLGALSGLYRKGYVPPDSQVSEAVVAFTNAVLQHWSSSLDSFSSEELVYVLTGAALLCPGLVPPSILTAMEVSLYPRLRSLTGADLAACMWALGRLSGDQQWAPDMAWLEQFLQASINKLAGLSNADLAAVLSALARFECLPAQPWLDALFVSLKSRTGSMSAGELQLLKYSCMKLGVAVEVE